MEVQEIARVCHEANRSYCQVINDPAFPSQKPWDEEPQWQRDTVINGVRFKIENPESTPADSHANWLRVKEAEGWVYGDVKDVEKKTHPCMVPYEQLPIEQRRKDALFQAIVSALSSD